MLDLGLHPSTPENEAQQSMKLAQRLLAKFNLKQADLQAQRNGGELQDSGALKGGMATVQLRVGVPGEPNWKPASIAIWMNGLGCACSNNFAEGEYETKANFYTCRGRRTTKFVFYGIRTSVQLAAYAFKVAVDRVLVMKDAYRVPEGEWERKWDSFQTNCKSKGAYTNLARLNYCQGITSGLEKAVREEKQKIAAEKERKLARARRRAAAAAAFEADRAPKDATKEDGESDGSGSSDESSEDSSMDGGLPSCDSDGDDDMSLADLHAKQARAKTKEVERRKVKVEKLESQLSTVGAIVVHTNRVAEKVLADSGIKLCKGRKRKRLSDWNADAFAQGKEDAKKIKLDQREIAGNG